MSIKNLKIGKYNKEIAHDLIKPMINCVVAFDFKVPYSFFFLIFISNLFVIFAWNNCFLFSNIIQ